MEIVAALAIFFGFLNLTILLALVVALVIWLYDLLRKFLVSGGGGKAIP